jgi:hypothetical protein
MILVHLKKFGPNLWVFMKKLIFQLRLERFFLCLNIMLKHDIYN